MKERKCTVTKCNRKHVAKGYCGVHYNRVTRHGDPHYQPVWSKDSPCKAEGCSIGGSHKGYCPKHYGAYKRHGDPLGSDSKPALGDDLHAHTIPVNGCMIWVHCIRKDGYGLVKHEGVDTLAHVASWRISNGEIPEGFEIDHRCRNRACINPEHLRLATRSQNCANKDPESNIAKSGFRNVHKKGDKWQVKVKKHGKTRHFGVFNELHEAVRAAAIARNELFGEFSGNATHPHARETNYE